jgi:hypothetical protein
VIYVTCHIVLANLDSAVDDKPYSVCSGAVCVHAQRVTLIAALPDHTMSTSDTVRIKHASIFLSRTTYSPRRTPNICSASGGDAGAWRDKEGGGKGVGARCKETQRIHTCGQRA